MASCADTLDRVSVHKLFIDIKSSDIPFAKIGNVPLGERYCVFFISNWVEDWLLWQSWWPRLVAGLFYQFQLFLSYWPEANDCFYGVYFFACNYGI